MQTQKQKEKSIAQIHLIFLKKIIFGLLHYEKMG
jgi:hypothetical protein